MPSWKSVLQPIYCLKVGQFKCGKVRQLKCGMTSSPLVDKYLYFRIIYIIFKLEEEIL
jgi:hypothetical protein